MAQVRETILRAKLTSADELSSSGPGALEKCATDAVVEVFHVKRVEGGERGQHGISPASQQSYEGQKTSDALLDRRGQESSSPENSPIRTRKSHWTLPTSS